MADDRRDRRVIKTPPRGVASQIARPEVDPETTPPAGSVPIDIEEAIDREAVPRRVKATKAAAVLTLDRVGEVRTELKEDISRLDNKVEKLAEHVGDLRETTGQMSGSIAIIREHLEQHSVMKVTAFQAEMEVAKTRGLADIEVSKTDKLASIEIKRHVVLKIVAAIGALWALISAWWIAT